MRKRWWYTEKGNSALEDAKLRGWVLEWSLWVCSRAPVKSPTRGMPSGNSDSSWFFHAPKCDPQYFWEILGLKYQWGNFNFWVIWWWKRGVGWQNFPYLFPYSIVVWGKKWNRMSNDLKKVKMFQKFLEAQKNVDYLKKGSDNKNRTWERDNEPGGDTVLWGKIRHDLCRECAPDVRWLELTAECWRRH